MLDDTPRKLLRIIVQFRYHFKRMPTLPELRRLSGRRTADIIKGFKILAAENYIAWEASQPIQTSVILEGWERVYRMTVLHREACRAVGAALT